MFAGIMVLVVMAAGLWILTSFGGFGGPPLPFLVLWVIVGLGGAAAAFYNAFSRRGLPLYEVDVDDGPEGFCPQCGKAVGSDDQFCRHCSASLT
jgi:hypothetical protein